MVFYKFAMDITKFSTESLKKVVQVLAPGSRMRKDIIKELILREKGEGDKEKDDKNLEKNKTLINKWKKEVTQSVQFVQVTKKSLILEVLVTGLR